MEEYRIIAGFEKYSISNVGNVKNNKTGRIVKQQLEKDGYYVVVLITNKCSKNLRIHRLVAQSFIQNPLNKDCVDHIDNNKINNNVENLRWVTKGENSMNAKLSKSNKVGVKGVFKINDSKYRAYIRKDNKMTYLGYFKTLEEAKNSRQKKANELFGEFTNICEKIIQKAKIQVNEILQNANDELEQLEAEFNDI